MVKCIVDQKGLPPARVVKFLKSRGIQFKDEHWELLELLQVPEVWCFIMGQLKEISKKYRRLVAERI